MAQTIIEKCHCWPRDIPYISDFTDPISNKLHWNGLDKSGTLTWCDVQEITRK